MMKNKCSLLIYNSAIVYFGFNAIHIYADIKDNLYSMSFNITNTVSYKLCQIYFSDSILPINYAA